VVPERGGPLVVGILEDRRAGLLVPAAAVLGVEDVEVRAGAGKPRGDVGGGRQEPGLGVAVAVLLAMGAVDVGHDRHRARVRAGRGLAAEIRPHVPAGLAARRVRPVQRGVDGQQVRKEVPRPVHQFVDPLDPHRPAVLGLDRKGGVVERAGMIGRAVAPDRRLGHARRQNLLIELANGDFVVAASSLGHGRRDDQRQPVLVDARGIEAPAGQRGADLPGHPDQRHCQPHSGGHARFEQLPSRQPGLAPGSAIGLREPALTTHDAPRFPRLRTLGDDYGLIGAFWSDPRRDGCLRAGPRRRFSPAPAAFLPRVGWSLHREDAGLGVSVSPSDLRRHCPRERRGRGGTKRPGTRSPQGDRHIFRPSKGPKNEPVPGA